MPAADKPLTRRYLHASRPRAFTLIELLIVIAVILILAAILLVGMRAITAGGKEKQTRQTLGNLRNMMAEFETQTRFGKAPPTWGWWDGTNEVQVRVGAPGIEPGVDFWRVPYNLEPANPPRPALPPPLDAPGDVRSTTDQPMDPSNVSRNGCRQLINTQLAMNLILSVPANNSAFQKLDPNIRFTPVYLQSVAVPAPGMDRVFHTMDDGTEDIWYFPGNRVIYQGRVYRCKMAHNSTSGPSVPTAGGGIWDEEGSGTEMFKSVPSAVLLDAWNNPILFVPASGLLVRQVGTKSAFDPADPSQTYVIVSPEGIAEAPQLGRAGQLLRAGKPFFVSAGPDGDYATAEDNLYSFED